MSVRSESPFVIRPWFDLDESADLTTLAAHTFKRKEIVCVLAFNIDALACLLAALAGAFSALRAVAQFDGNRARVVVIQDGERSYCNLANDRICLLGCHESEFKHFGGKFCFKDSVGVVILVN